MADPTGFVLNIAIQAAISLAIAALTPKQRIEGPRLDDTTIMSSAYGRPIPLGYGTDIVAGNIIWGKDIEEEARTMEIGKGNPFSVGTRTEYRYYLTCAVAFSSRRINSLLGIYADGRLIYSNEEVLGSFAAQDLLPETLESLGGTGTGEQESRITQLTRDLDFALYEGTEDQQPDPLISEDVGADVCPAFRGTAYVVFNRMPLKDYGNRVPQFRFVVAWVDPDEVGSYYIATGNKDDVVKNTNFAPYLYNEERNTIWSIRQASTQNPDLSGTEGYIEAAEAINGETLQTFPVRWQANSDLQYFVGGVGPYLAWANKLVNQSPIVCFDPREGEVVAQTDDVVLLTGFSKPPALGSGSFPAGSGSMTFGHVIQYDTGEPIVFDFSSATGGIQIMEVLDRAEVKYFLVGGHAGSHGTLWSRELPTLALRSTHNVGDIGHLEGGDPFLTFNELREDSEGFSYLTSRIGFGGDRGLMDCIMGKQELKRTDIWVMTRVTLEQDNPGPDDSGDYPVNGEYLIRKWQITMSGSMGPVLGADAAGGRIPRTDFVDQGPNKAGAPNAFLDLEREYMILERGLLMVCYDLNEFRPNTTYLREVWRLSGYEAIDNVHDCHARIVRGGRILRRAIGTTPASGNFVVIDTETGRIVETFNDRQFTLGDGLGTNALPSLYDPKYKRGLSYTGPLGWQYFGPVYDRQSEPLSAVVRDIVTRGKLTDADIDVTGIASKSVRGYVISKALSYRAALEPLATAYNMIGVEANGRLVFSFRGESPNFTISEDDLVIRNNGVTYETRREDETTVPRAVTVTYRSVSLKDETGAQKIGRPADSLITTNSRGEVSLELPLVLTDNEAIQIAERILYESRVNLDNFEFSLPPKYLGLLPGDIVDIQYDGRVDRILIERASVGADFLIEAEGVITDSALYTSSMIGAPAFGSPSFSPNSQLPPVLDVEGFILDIPLLRDTDLPGRDAGALMLGGVGVLPASQDARFVAGLVERSTGIGFAAVAFVNEPLAWGVVISEVPDIRNIPWNSVEEETIRVRMIGGAEKIASVDEQDMLREDLNAALLYRPVSDMVEVIGFRDAVELEADPLATNAPSVFDLTGLMRGRRGTDTNGFDYPAINSDGTVDEEVFFILLERNALDGWLEENALNETSVDYYGTPVVDAEVIVTRKEKDYWHRSLRPYAVIHPRLTSGDPSSGDYTIQWVRRTRQNGQLRDGDAPMPISEDDERYAVVIYDGEFPPDKEFKAKGSNGKRVLTSVGTPSVTYTFAQIEEDWGGVLPNPLLVRIFQISGQVGRGFAYDYELVPNVEENEWPLPS